MDCFTTGGQLGSHNFAYLSGSPASSRCIGPASPPGPPRKSWLKMLLRLIFQTGDLRASCVEEC